MQNKKGFFARQFHAAVSGSYALRLKGNLAALSFVVPALAFSGAATPAGAEAQDNTPPGQDVKTLHSKNIERLNAQFNRVGAYDRILFIDRDKILEKAVLKQNMTPAEAMAKSIEEYFLETAGVQVDEQIVNIIQSGIQGGGGLALPIRRANDKAGGGGICLIVGQSPDTSAGDQQKRMLGLYPGMHDDLMARQYGQTFSKEIYQKLTDYHELGHCMDKWYIKKFTAQDSFPRTLDDLVGLRHQAEVFGEVFGLLMMARDGHTDIAQKRADHRMINLMTTGAIFAQEFLWDSEDKYTGYMYALHEAIMDAQRTIQRIGVDGLRNMEPDQIADIAHRITEDEALSHENAGWAITFMLMNRFDLQAWERLRHEYPHVEEAYQIAVRVRDQVSQAAIRVFGAEYFDQTKPIWKQIENDPSKIRRSQPLEASRVEGIVRSVQRDIVYAAGGARATEVDVLRAAMREKDRLRAIFDLAQNGPAQQDASIRLIFIDEATRRAIIDIRNRPAHSPQQPQSGGGDVLRPAA